MARLVRHHRDRNDVGILVHCATGGIDTKSDETAENDVPGGHGLSVGRNDAGPHQVTLFSALDGEGGRALGEDDRAGRSHHLWPALRGNRAGRSRHARRIDCHRL